MKPLCKVASVITLGLVVIPCLLLFLGMIGLDAVKLLALIGTIGWFAVTPIWMGREMPVDAKEVEI
ncbi:hypothetical protein [Neorhodopirellula lusitana]|uniref:hypothetical protein n=1 Tax=Neorhodopirellula lusitana TaxID=445327 RepID=UPI00384FC23E